jgi:cytochrome c biogenesis protein CcdA
MQVSLSRLSWRVPCRSIAVRYAVGSRLYIHAIGIGVEQLQQGNQPRSRLLTSSLAFVAGFFCSVYHIWASASAVGQFLQRNRS